MLYLSRLSDSMFVSQLSDSLCMCLSRLSDSLCLFLSCLPGIETNVIIIMKIFVKRKIVTKETILSA